MIADQLTHDRLTYRPDHLDIEMCRGVHGFAPQAPGSDNAINVVHATVAALKLLQRPEEVAARRGLPIEDVAPAGMLKARRKSEALAASVLPDRTI